LAVAIDHDVDGAIAGQLGQLDTEDTRAAVASIRPLGLEDALRRDPVEIDTLAVRDNHARDLVLRPARDVHRRDDEWAVRDLFQRDGGLAAGVRAGVELPVEEPGEERALLVRRLAVA